MVAKREPTSPGKASVSKASKLEGDGTGKGKGKAVEHESHAQDDGLQKQFGMADWVQDPALWDKIGADSSGSNLGDPVKTIEVGSCVSSNDLADSPCAKPRLERDLVVFAELT